MNDVASMVPESIRQSIDRSQVTVVIGLEVHVQLATESKLFCGCSTQYGSPANTQTCSVCTGMPGSLPVLNEHALELAVKTGLALHCDIARYTKWDRKNYFYPDLPKGYQISQFDQPVCNEGYLDVSDAKDRFEPVRVRIERAHLEEDAGKSIHDEAHSGGHSKIDLNRTGTPLLEIVTRPDIRSAAQAKAFLTELKLILQYTQVSDCNMQEGSLRCDGNINLHLNIDGRTVATPIVEIKNMNSFRNVERALEHEVERQFALWQRTGAELGQAPKQTRGWDDAAQVTTLQREKEDSADYRYFPDPDLTPIRLSDEYIQSVGEKIDMLPHLVRQQLTDEFQLGRYDADVIVSQGVSLVRYYREVAKACNNGKQAANWVGQEVLRHLNDADIAIEEYPVDASALAMLISKVIAGELDQTRGKEVLNEMVTSQISIDQAMDKLGIVQVDDSQLEAICQQLIEENESVVAQIRDGNLKAVGALIGKARKLNPNANPGKVKSMLVQLITGS